MYSYQKPNDLNEARLSSYHQPIQYQQPHVQPPHLSQSFIPPSPSSLSPSSSSSFNPSSTSKYLSLSSLASPAPSSSTPTPRSSYSPSNTHNFVQFDSHNRQSSHSTNIYSPNNSSVGITSNLNPTIKTSPTLSRPSFNLPPILDTYKQNSSPSFFTPHSHIPSTNQNLSYLPTNIKNAYINQDNNADNNKNPFYSYFFMSGNPDFPNTIETFQNVALYHHNNFIKSSQAPVNSLHPHAFTIPPETANQLNAFQVSLQANTKFSNNSDLILMDSAKYSHFIQNAFLTYECINFFIHKPTFVAKEANSLLLLILVIMGMTATDSKNLKPTTPLFFKIRKRLITELNNIKFNSNTVDILSNLQLVQAYSLVLWATVDEDVTYSGTDYISNEDFISPGQLYHICGGKFLKLGGFLANSREETAIYYENGRVRADSKCFKFANLDSISLETNIYGNNSSQDSIKTSLWKCWITHESCVRILMFIFDIIMERLCIDKELFEFRLNEIDLAMNSPECLWICTSYKSFFETVGNEGAIETVSYLSLLKSSLKIPTLIVPKSRHSIEANKSPDLTVWTLGSYIFVIYGLSFISWAVGSGPPHLFDLIHRGMDRNYNPATCTFRRLLNSYSQFVPDHSIQARVLYAFEKLEYLGERATSHLNEAEFIDYMGSSAVSNSFSRPSSSNKLDRFHSMSHIPENDLTPPWVCTTISTLHFQMCYFTIANDTNDYLNIILEQIPSRIEVLNYTIDNGTNTLKSRYEIENFLVLGYHPSNSTGFSEISSQYATFLKWIKNERTENYVVLSAYFLLHIVHARTSLTFGAKEAKQSRVLLMKSLMYIWLWDYGTRDHTFSNINHGTHGTHGNQGSICDLIRPLSEIWHSSNSLQHISSQDIPLIEESLKYLYKLWRETRGAFLSPMEKLEQYNSLKQYSLMSSHASMNTLSTPKDFNDLLQKQHYGKKVLDSQYFSMQNPQHYWKTKPEILFRIYSYVDLCLSINKSFDKVTQLVGDLRNLSNKLEHSNIF